MNNVESVERLANMGKFSTTYLHPRRKMMSYQMEAKTSGEFATNACRYATREEAENAGHELMSRWFACTETRAAESTDAVNYRFNKETWRNEPLK